MLGLDFNSRGMETCRGSIPPLWRYLLVVAAFACVQRELSCLGLLGLHSPRRHAAEARETTAMSSVAIALFWKFVTCH